MDGGSIGQTRDALLGLRPWSKASHVVMKRDERTYVVVANVQAGMLVLLFQASSVRSGLFLWTIFEVG